MAYFVVSLIAVLYLSWRIYATYYRPMKKFKHFEERARKYQVRRKYQTALDIRKQALNLENLSKQEHAHLLLAIGGVYLELNSLDDAARYFDVFFQKVRDLKFPYDKQYRRVIQTYINGGRSNDAKRILEELIARQSYDRRFKRFEKLRAELFQ